MSFFKRKEKSDSSDKPDIDDSIIEIMGLPPSEAPAQSTDNSILVSAEQVENESESQTEEPKETIDSLSEDDAVDDIVTQESDELLKIQDDKVHSNTTSKKSSHRNFIKTWWQNKKLRNNTFIFLFIAAAVLLAIPQTRYTVLNVAGARASTSFVVIDSKSGKPIKNVQAFIGSASAKSNEAGEIKITGIKLGEQMLILKKRSFSELTQKVTIGLGSNPYDAPLELSPTGTTYTFVVTDWLSSGFIVGAEVSDGESTAIADAAGKAELIIQPKDDTINISIKANGYRSEQLKLSAEDVTVKNSKLVIDVPHVFVSKRTGKYNLYKSDADGKNETVLLEATGKERPDIDISLNNDGSKVAHASTRDGERNSEGYAQTSLYMVNTEDGRQTKLAVSERIQIIGWTKDTLVYVRVASGASAANAKRERLVAYNYEQDQEKELAMANGFGSVLLIQDNLYYTINNPPGVGTQSGVYRSSVDGNNKLTIVDKETWGVYRTSFEKLSINTVGNKWYEHKFSDNTKAGQLATPPTNPVDKFFVTNSNKTASVYVDKRDGKGVLILVDASGQNEKVIQTKSGLDYPVSWLSDKHLQFRVLNSQETADYIINTDGGESFKLGDVTSTGGSGSWYYY